MNDTTQTALTNQLSQPSENSKKYKMTMRGLEAVLVIFLATTVAFIFNPAALQPLLTFAGVSITGVSGLVAIYAGAQAVVDRQTTISLGK